MNLFYDQLPNLLFIIEEIQAVSSTYSPLVKDTYVHKQMARTCWDLSNCILLFVVMSMAYDSAIKPLLVGGKILIAIAQ